MVYKKGDFHIHSCESDGDLNPGEIVLLAKDRKVDIIAMTDHNTVSGNKQAIKVGDIYGVKVIPGIELSTRFKGNRVHILGYFYNDMYEGDKFKDTLNYINKGKFKVCSMINHGECSFRCEGGKLTTRAGIEFLHYFGAKVVLAHPTLLKKSIVSHIIEMDFDGIEARYYRNKENETEEFINIAKEKGIIYTAGSDFHSAKKIDLKHGMLGQIFLDEEEIDDFLKILKV